MPQGLQAFQSPVRPEEFITLKDITEWETQQVRDSTSGSHTTRWTWIKNQDLTNFRMCKTFAEDVVATIGNYLGSDENKSFRWRIEIIKLPKGIEGPLEDWVVKTADDECLEANPIPSNGENEDAQTSVFIFDFTVQDRQEVKISSNA